MLCVSSVGSAFIVFLIPEGNMKKTANTVITLFLLSIVVFPVSGKELFDIDVPDFSIEDFPDEEEYVNQYDDFILSNSADVVEEHIENILIDICKDEFDLQVEMIKDSSGNFTLYEIHIFVSNDDFVNVRTIESEVAKLTGMHPDVEIIGI